MKMMFTNTPQGRYHSEKLISAIATANFKPINTYPYYTEPKDFTASIYHRKSGNNDNTPLQEHCFSVFKEIYTPDTIKDMLVGLISQIMTL